jgi:Tfp pilus assembly protein PilO
MATHVWHASAMQRFNNLTIQRFRLLSSGLFCQSGLMRLMVEILIIVVVIFLGWTKPFKEHYAQLNRTMTTALNDVESKLHKHQDASVKRH